MEKLLSANKNSQYQIKEKDKKFYHLKFTVETPTPDGRGSDISERFQIFSPIGFKQYLANKGHFNWKKEEIIHDPTLLVASTPEVAKVEVQPTADEQGQPEKKQPYFGSERQKADIERKKQLKNNEK